MSQPWSARCTLVLLALQLASACTPNEPPTPAEDRTAPTTTATPAGGQYSGSVTVSLRCDDGAGSGCEATHYTTDGSEPTRGSPTFRDALTLDATTPLRFFSVDKAGNAEAVKSETYTLGPPSDTLAPTTTATPPGGLFRAAPTVTLSCDDADGGGCAAIHYTLDGSEPTSSSPRYTEPLALTGTTVLQFFSVDVSGNREAVKAQTYTLDTAPPTTVASPAGGFTRSARGVTLACEDGAGGGCAATYYTVDGSAPTSQSTRYTGPIAVTATTTLRFFSVDRADNAESPRTEVYTLDTAVPTVSASPAGGTSGSVQSVTLTCADGTGSGCAAIHYTTDGSAPTTASPVYSAPLSLAASTTLKFLALDVAGNASPLATERYVIDTAGPTTTASPRGGSFPSTFSVTLLCDDAGGTGCAATHYTTNGSEPSLASPRYTAPIPVTATTTLRFFSVDAIGHQGPRGSETYVLDFEAPTTTATPGGYFAQAPQVMLSCADGTGSGCKATYYTLDGTTPSEASLLYTGPVPLTASATLKFFSVDGAGNREGVKAETYRLDTTAPTTTATPGGGLYGSSQTVRLSCADEAGGSGCEATHYTTDGSEPTLLSPQYSDSQPLSLTATTQLRFFSVDAVGNAEPVRVLQYTIDREAPTTTASPSGGTASGPLGVTLSCVDSGGGGCAGTWYTLDGSEPTQSSTRYTSALTLASSATLRFFSVDTAGNTEPPRTEVYTFSHSAAETSAQLAAVRDPLLPAGPISQAIDLALVTYVKPLTPTDPAGFFLQAEPQGPALFVAVDPATLPTPPQPGDRVSLLATQKAVVNGQPRVGALTGYVTHGRGESVAALLTDASAVDLVASLDTYDSMYLTVTGTVASAFTSGGNGHVQATLSTVGVPGNANLKLRLPTTLQDSLDVAPGCSVTTTAPLWRYLATAQPMAWAQQDLVVNSCPAPKVLGAMATSSTSLKVTFDRYLDAASVQAGGGQFLLSGGLSATSATGVGREVWLTTTEQVPGASYGVTVVSTVRDTYGTGVQPPDDSASFIGFVPPAVLRLNEVAPNVLSHRDLVELRVMQAGSTANLTLVADATVLATLPDVQVAVDDLIVVHLNPDKVALNADAPGSETLGKSEHSQAVYTYNYDTAWDFHGGLLGISFSNATLRVKDAAGNTQDAVAFARPLGSPPANYPQYLQALQAEGLWQPPDCLGTPCTYTSYPTAVDVSANWSGASSSYRTGDTVYRVGSIDTDSGSDWTVTLGVNSLGLHNP